MPQASVDPTKISPADLAKLLSKAGGVAVSAETIQADLEAGAPQNADGTIHLIHYTAWLVAQVP